MTFDLLTQPWIPVVTRTGVHERVSLRNVFVRAPELRLVYSDSPLHTAALYRLLLAFAHRFEAGPATLRDHVSLLSRGRFDTARLDSYCEKHADRFDLFHTHAPFLQVADFDAADLSGPGRRPVWKLHDTKAVGNNTILWDKRSDAHPAPISPADAAIFLVGHQAFSLNAGNSVTGYVPGSPLARAMHTIAIGPTLFHTLALNLAPYPVSERERDLPAWEREPVHLDEVKGPAPRASLGRTDRYVWLSAAVRLHPEENEAGRLQVRETSWGGGFTPFTSHGTKWWADDPMITYTRTKKGALRPVAMKPDRHVWRDYPLLLQVEANDRVTPPRTVLAAQQALEAADHPVTMGVTVFGQATDNSAILATYQETAFLPSGVQQGLARPHLFMAIMAVETCFTTLEKIAYATAREILKRRRSTIDEAPDVPKKAVRTLLDQLFSKRAKLAFWTRAEVAFEYFQHALASCDASNVEAMESHLAAFETEMRGVTLDVFTMMRRAHRHDYDTACGFAMTQPALHASLRPLKPTGDGTHK